MKRLFTLLFFIFQFAIFNSQDWKLSVEPIFGMKYGEIGEYVFEKDTDGDYFKESELNWEMHPVWYFGGKIEGGYKKILGRIRFDYTIPNDCGITHDSDWLNPSDRSIKTTYSKSENTLISNYDFSIFFKYDFQPIEKLKIAPTFEWKYAYISFEARNGYGWYGHDVKPIVEWNNPNAIFHKKGELGGIDYTRKAWHTFLGFEIEYNPFSQLKLLGNFAISPWTETTSYDTHWDLSYKTGTDYADDVFSYFTRLKGSVGVYYILNKKIEIGLTASIFGGFIDSGTNYSKTHGTSKFDNNSPKVEGGASVLEFTTELSCRFRIF